MSIRQHTQSEGTSNRFFCMLQRLQPRSFRAKLALAFGSMFIIMLLAVVVVQFLVTNLALQYNMRLVSPQMSGWDRDDMPNIEVYNDGKGADVTGEMQAMGSDGFRLDTPIGAMIWTRDTMVDALRISSIVVVAVFGLAGLVLVWLLTSRLSRRLANIEAQTSSLEPSNLHARIKVPDARGNGDEVTRLGEAINDMLDRVERVSQAERRFVSNASHELRTPIAAIRTSLEAPLTQGRFDSSVEPAVRRALAANERGERLVEALLQLSRIQSGYYDKHDDKISRKPCVPIHDVLVDVMQRYDQQLREHDMNVTMDVPADTMVTAEPALLTLAVDNLVRNAIAHGCSSGTIAISLDTPASPRKRETESITTTDSPTTFDLVIANDTDEPLPSDLTELTQPFHRGSNSRLSAVGGVGLGLSIVQAAAEACSGRLVLSSPTSNRFEARLRLKKFLSDEVAEE